MPQAPIGGPPSGVRVSRVRSEGVDFRQKIPHERLALVAGDRRTGQLTYRDLDSGEVFKVPNVRYNLLPQARLEAEIADSVWWSYLRGLSAVRHRESARRQLSRFHNAQADQHFADASRLLAQARALCVSLSELAGVPRGLAEFESLLGVRVS